MAVRTTVTLTDDTAYVMGEIKNHTGITPPELINKILLGHLSELWEYLRHLESLPEGESPARSQAINLLRSYGPASLSDSVKHAKENPWTR
ncbi:hypothetical protein C7444_115110 [Sphaerotilus hippei]|uniref:Uncharacterized protein n=1 Tax=Sphaerotilus hippei TaxID=744406 RepID=A0A318H156_9BURK|nr:hypothetical protein [Sphaerotilus hippei]PXW94215.1 hypothetical protein C7444_115110 [Sphaerotilus hippei]